MPNLYDDCREMNALQDTIQCEFDLINSNITCAFDDTFPKKATAAGVAKWEALFDILYDPECESLEFRRERLVSRLSSNIPFSQKALEERLDSIIGKGCWEYELDFRAYSLIISVLTPGTNLIAEMRSAITLMMPANMTWELHAYAVKWQGVKEDYIDWGGLCGKTWREVRDGI